MCLGKCSMDNEAIFNDAQTSHVCNILKFSALHLKNSQQSTYKHDGLLSIK